MRRILSWIVWAPVAVLVISFVLANRQWVALSLDPLSPEPFLAISMPLWTVFMAGLFLGIIVGWTGCWLRQSRHRKRARAQQAELERLRRLTEAKPPENPQPEPPNPLTVSM